MSKDKNLIQSRWTVTQEHKRRLRKEACRRATEENLRASESKVLRDIIDNSNLPK